MQLNNHHLVDRNNRPNVSQRVGLRALFMNDGAYVDPYEISSVQLFAKTSILTPHTVLDSDNQVSAIPLMEYGASGSAKTDRSNFDPSNYNPAVTASGIYRIGVGDYIVVLDETLALSGFNYVNEVTVDAGDLSSVNDYADLWTVKLDSASKYQVITNSFSLYQDSFYAFTEPLIITTSNTLLNKHVRLGEKIQLKLTTEATIQNKSIPESVQNIFKDSVVTSATITVKRVNDNPALDGPFVAVDGEEMDVTGDNTLLYLWDTTSTSEPGIPNEATFGGRTGTFSVQVTYNVLNQTIISPLYYLTVS